MDIKQLLEKMEEFAGEKVGQKPGDHWRGDDPNPPGKKLVGSSESVLKDLSKGRTPKSKEQELSEEFQAFLEAEFKDTVDKRPRRKNARPARGHAPQPGYKTVKADEGAETAPAALADPIVAKVVKQMRPGLTGLDMGNEAFLYFAYELGKQRAREMWSEYLPAIRAEYEKGLSEGWESGPEEYQEPYDDADDAYDRQRQEKIDTEAEKEWAKLPKVSTYKLVGRGPNMEPNYEFGGKEYDTLEAAIEARKQLMADPETPHPEHIGISTLTRVVNQANEAIDSDIVQAMGQDSFNRAGYNPIRDERDYLDKLSKLSNLSRKPGLDQAMKDHITQRINDLNAEARKKGYTQVESRGHNVIATKLKNLERERKFAKGELKIPTPQERQAQLKRLEKEPKQVKEYGATSTGSPTSTSTDDVKKAMAATSTLKAATGTPQSAPLLMKAMDTISQGKTASSTDMMVAQNTLQDINTAFKEPELANQLKPILAKANQFQQKK